MYLITTFSLVFLSAFLTHNLLTLKLNKIECMTCSLIQEQLVKNQLFHQLDRRLIVTTVAVHVNRKYRKLVDLLRKVEN